MLAQLTISNFAIVRELEIDFNAGMTAITGETAPVNPLRSMRWVCVWVAVRRAIWCAPVPAARISAPASR